VIERKAPAATGARVELMKRKKVASKPRKRASTSRDLSWALEHSSVELDPGWRKIEETLSIPDLLRALKTRGITAKTHEILDAAAKLEAQEKPYWPVAEIYWPHLSPLYTRVSKHRETFDALVAK
jgi:hypothetical protein